MSSPLPSARSAHFPGASAPQGEASEGEPIANDLTADLARAKRNTFGVAWGMILLGGVGLLVQILEKAPLWWLEVGLVAAVPVTGVMASLLARKQDRQWRGRSPQRIRVLPDRVIGEFDPAPGVRNFSASRALRFQRGMLFFESGGSYGVPRVVCWPPPRGWLDELAAGDVEKPAIALALSRANVLAVKRAWETWNATAQPSADQGVPEAKPVSPDLARSLAAAPITWVDNRLPDPGDPVNTLKLAWGIVAVTEVAFFALAEAYLGPLFGPVVALESAYYWLWYWPVLPFAFPAFEYLRRYLRARPRVGVDGKGVYLTRKGRKPRFVPWSRVFGPSRQIFKGNFIMHIGKRDGSFYMWDFVQLGPEAAELIATHPLCPRRKMNRADAETLGLLV